MWKKTALAAVIGWSDAANRVGSPLDANPAVNNGHEIWPLHAFHGFAGFSWLIDDGMFSKWKIKGWCHNYD
jgi:hypothetical protein